MNHVVVSPMQWTQLPDMEVMNHELDSSDAECLAELRQVLAKHGRLERFGISLLHRHFHLSDDECLLESVDAVQRVLTVRAVSKTAIGQAVQTQWSLAHRDPLQWCEQWCNYSGGTHHSGHQNHIALDN
jgi:hypothetical protein